MWVEQNPNAGQVTMWNGRWLQQTPKSPISKGGKHRLSYPRAGSVRRQPSGDGLPQLGGQRRLREIELGVADNFGAYSEPALPAEARPTPLPPSDRPLALSRPAALTASGARGLLASALRLAASGAAGHGVVAPECRQLSALPR